MTKEVKTKMKELIKQMRDIDEASSESELPEVPKPEKAPDTDTESSSSFDFRGGEGNAKARDGSRKRVWKGTPSNAAKLSLVPEEPAKAVEPKVEEEEDEDEDMGDGKEEPAEAGKKKKKKKRRKSKKIRKRKMSLRILGMALMAHQEAQEEPVMAQEALAWGLPWWLQLEKAKAAKKSLQRLGVKA